MLRRGRSVSWASAEPARRASVRDTTVALSTSPPRGNGFTPPPLASRRAASLAEGLHDSEPEREQLGARIADVARRGVDQDELRLGIDEYALPSQAPQDELPLWPGHNPRLVAIAEERARLPGLELLGRWCSRHAHPAGRDDLAAVERAIIGEQHAEPGVVAHGGVDSEERGLVAAFVDGPGGVGLGAHRLPDLRRQIVGERLRRRCAEDQPQDLRLR